MPAFVADLPAAQVDVALRESLRELRAAEQSSVLYFAEVMSRRLYRELGYATIRQYAVDRLQFSRSKTGYFVQLAAALKRLPRIRAAVACGELPWTKAAEVVKVATPRTEERWLEVARSSGRRELADKVRRARGIALRGGGEADLFSAPVVAGAGGAGSPMVDRAAGAGLSVVGAAAVGSAVVGGGLGDGVGVGAAPGTASEPSMLGTKVHEMGASGLGVPAQEVESIQPGVWACVMETSLSCEPAQEMEGSLPEDLPPAATDVRFRLSSEQRGRFEAMIEKLRKLGEKGDRTELMLEAMALLVLERTEARRCERIEAKHRDHSSRIAEVYREPAAPPAPRASAGVDGAPTPESASRLALGNPNPPNVLPENTPRVHSSRAVLPVYQVYVRSCEQCDRGWLETTTGSQLLDTATLRAILCDCRVSRPGEPNQHAIPPRLRREALERDGYRCRARGCGSHRFLNVHHMHATADGGPHRIDNVITVCNPCHTLVHGLRGNEPALVRELTVASRAAVL